VLFAWHPGEVRLVKTPSAAAGATGCKAAKRKALAIASPEILTSPGAALGVFTKRTPRDAKRKALCRRGCIISRLLKNMTDFYFNT